MNRGADFLTGISIANVQFPRPNQLTFQVLFFPEQPRKQLLPGVATGLTWIAAGGEVLYVEVTLLPGGRGVTPIRQIGEIMQESAQAAYSYLWSHSETFGIDQLQFRKSGIHIHVPAGAIPTDGPSAGVIYWGCEGKGAGGPADGHSPRDPAHGK
jgi:ATP-dependent Lon protease